MQDFRKLTVWRKAHELTLEMYKITVSFPNEEKYGLTSQIRRATSSIPTNIVEGCGHTSKKEFARYLQIAIASTSETEYLLELSKDLEYLKNDYKELNLNTIEIRKMLIALKRSLN